MGSCASVYRWHALRNAVGSKIKLVAKRCGHLLHRGIAVWTQGVTGSVHQLMGHPSSEDSKPAGPDGHNIAVHSVGKEVGEDGDGVCVGRACGMQVSRRG